MADTTQQATAPGLEAKAQQVFDIPYAELAEHLQDAVRRFVLEDAAEDMLEALKACSPLLIPDMTWSDETGQLVKRLVMQAIAKAEGHQ